MELHELLPLQNLSKSSHFNALPLWFPFLLALCWPTLDHTNSSAFTKSVVKFTSRFFQSCSLIFLLSPSAITITGFFWAASLAFASQLLKTANVLTHSVWRRGPKIPHGFQDLIAPSEFSGLWLVWSLSWCLFLLSSAAALEVSAEDEAQALIQQNFWRKWGSLIRKQHIVSHL